jgi:hypothetical protein
MPTDGPKVSLKAVTAACWSRIHEANDQQRSLLSLACARRVQHLVPAPALHGLVDRVEQALDRRRSRAVKLPPCSRKLIEELIEQGHAPASPTVLAAHVCLNTAQAPLNDYQVVFSVSMAWQAAWQSRLGEDDFLPPRGRRARRRRFQETWLALLDDLLPDPAPALAVEPGWRTPLVASLVSSILDERDYSLTPILADALEDAGCGCAELLEHLRWHPVHVRGCWALERLCDGA